MTLLILIQKHKGIESENGQCFFSIREAVHWWKYRRLSQKIKLYVNISYKEGSVVVQLQLLIGYPGLTGFVWLRKINKKGHRCTFLNYDSYTNNWRSKLRDKL